MIDTTLYLFNEDMILPRDLELTCSLFLVPSENKDIALQTAFDGLLFGAVLQNPCIAFQMQLSLFCLSDCSIVSITIRIFCQN